MKKDEKIMTNEQLKNNNTQSQAEQTLKGKDNIKDYSRAWEDDRL
ncbi:hypothetical protein [Neobacillus ginsengisoli]|uniref:Uncharacterized protein n=1 Tax=Neobacillus ginsengisoli TaxID=904295 RepID=A0ABT9XY30_9BACI|nr:hypothetical protein [Neobacillus ginsengisoli]MDQ0200381.1 hypothetical protein [Neobacillus ginsengisoli]